MTHSATISMGSPDALRRVVIFHGYTGSPDEFRELATTLSERLDAYVLVPLLPGHGTDERELLDISFDDLLRFAQQTVSDVRAGAESVAIIGHSFGGYLALLAGAGISPAALILSVIPYELRLRFWLPWTARVMRLKKFWDKELTAEEEESRKGLYFYPRMPGIALSLVNDGISRINKILDTITCPILTIHNNSDPITTGKSGLQILAKSGHNPHNQNIVLKHISHGLYYGPDRREVVAAIADFLEIEMTPPRNN